jgi:hypothetical protein
MLYDLASQDVSLMQNPGEHTTSVSIDNLVQKSGGTYNLYEHRNNGAKIKGNIQPM